MQGFNAGGPTGPIELIDLDSSEMKLLIDALECFIQEYCGAAPEGDIDRAEKLRTKLMLRWQG